MIPPDADGAPTCPDADGAPTCGSWSSLAAAAGVSNPVSNDWNPVACLMGAQLSAATGRSSDSSAACASAKKSRARKVGSAAPVMFAGEDLMFGKETEVREAYEDRSTRGQRDRHGRNRGPLPILYNITLCTRTTLCFQRGI